MNSEMISWKGCPYIAFAKCSGTHTQFFAFSIGDMLISAVNASEFEYYYVLGCDIMVCGRYLSLFWRDMLGNRYVRNTDEILPDYMATNPSSQ
jgi:hypothetical protein